VESNRRRSYIEKHAEPVAVAQRMDKTFEDEDDDEYEDDGESR
jgi:hypothetical protein